MKKITILMQSLQLNNINLLSILFNVFLMAVNIFWANEISKTRLYSDIIPTLSI